MGHRSESVSRLVRAGALTALADGLFSSVLVVVAYHSTFARLWQGVASVLAGPRAINGGASMVALGLALHVGVAFAWSAVFLFLVYRWSRVQRLVASRYGVIKAAALYGPFIWMMMSLVVIPLFTHKPPAITFRWWVQWFGHIPFVGIPIVAMSAERGPA